MGKGKREDQYIVTSDSKIMNYLVNMDNSVANSFFDSNSKLIKTMKYATTFLIYQNLFQGVGAQVISIANAGNVVGTNGNNSNILPFTEQSTPKIDAISIMGKFYGSRVLDDVQDSNASIRLSNSDSFANTEHVNLGVSNLEEIHRKNIEQAIGKQAVADIMPSDEMIKKFNISTDLGKNVPTPSEAEAREILKAHGIDDNFIDNLKTAQPNAETMTQNKDGTVTVKTDPVQNIKNEKEVARKLKSLKEKIVQMRQEQDAINERKESFEGKIQIDPDISDIKQKELDNQRPILEQEFLQVQNKVDKLGNYRKGVSIIEDNRDLSTKIQDISKDVDELEVKYSGDIGNERFLFSDKENLLEVLSGNGMVSVRDFVELLEGINPGTQILKSNENDGVIVTDLDFKSKLEKIKEQNNIGKDIIPLRVKATSGEFDDNPDHFSGVIIYQDTYYKFGYYIDSTGREIPESIKQQIQDIFPNITIRSYIGKFGDGLQRVENGDVIGNDNGSFTIYLLSKLAYSTRLDDLNKVAATVLDSELLGKNIRNMLHSFVKDNGVISPYITDNQNYVMPAIKDFNKFKDFHEQTLEKCKAKLGVNAFVLHRFSSRKNNESVDMRKSSYKSHEGDEQYNYNKGKLMLSKPYNKDIKEFSQIQENEEDMYDSEGDIIDNSGINGSDVSDFWKDFSYGHIASLHVKVCDKMISWKGWDVYHMVAASHNIFDTKIFNLCDQSNNKIIIYSPFISTTADPVAFVRNVYSAIGDKDLKSLFSGIVKQYSNISIPYNKYPPAQLIISKCLHSGDQIVGDNHLQYNYKDNPAILPYYTYSMDTLKVGMYLVKPQKTDEVVTKDTFVMVSDNNILGMKNLAKSEAEYLINTYFVSWNGEEVDNSVLVGENPWYAQTFVAEENGG